MTPRELAAAIRAGAKRHPQGIYVYAENGKTCAIGAAVCGLNLALRGDGPINEAAARLARRLNLTTKIDTCRIFYMNDHGQTREQIADWLDTLDPSQPKDAQTFERFMAATLAIPESVTREDEVTI